MTTISAIRYAVEIQPPSSMPAPIAPWTSASEALTIWMFSTAMKAPSVAPSTATQVRIETSGEADAAGAGAAGREGRADSVDWSAGMGSLLQPAQPPCGRDAGLA